MFGELCGGAGGSCLGETMWRSCAERCVGRCGGARGSVWVAEGSCVCVTSVTRWSSMHTSLPPCSTPSTIGIPHHPLTNRPAPAPPPIPAHSSSQVDHYRVCPPLPLHAPVLVLHLAVYPASPTHGRVGLTDSLQRSAQTQRTDTVQPDQMKSVSQ